MSWKQTKQRFTENPTVQKVRANPVYRAISWVYHFLLSNWFFCLLGVFVGLAYKFPEFAKQGGMLRAEYTIGYGAVAIIFLISGLSMSSRDLLKNMLNWRAHFIVLTSSFLITSAIIYGICSGIYAAHNDQIDDWVLVGLIVTHACPTTVSSNVVMTKQAHGNDILTLCEVFIGNLLGAFITPAILQMYMQGQWDFGNPKHQGGQRESMSSLYGSTMQQLGSSVFAPLFVGQVIQNIWPKQTKWVLTTFKLSKVGSFMLLLIMFQSFSTAFAQNAFESVSHLSIVFLVLFNLGIYLFFTVLCFFYARPWWIIKIFNHEPTEADSKLYTYGYKLLRPFYWNKRDTVAILLCGPAKTAALGVSLVSSQYGAHNPRLGIILVPLVLYQAEQVLTAQVLTKFMKKWIYADEPKDDEEHLRDDPPEVITDDVPVMPEDVTVDSDSYNVEKQAPSSEDKHSH
ncbi:solute carrier Rch1p [Diutina catenulata]